jgi:hypothetical protein
MGNPKRRKHETHDLNPSPVAQSKLHKEMGTPKSAERTMGNPKGRKHET